MVTAKSHFPSELIAKCGQAVEKTFEFIERNGIATYDPNDIPGAPIFVWATSGKSLFAGACRKTLRALDARFPIAMRRVAGIKPKISAGGMAFYASALVDRGEQGDFKKARELLGWLDSNKITKHGGEAWGFPFAWPSMVLVPPYTGIGHTTMCCGNAFWNYFRATNDPWGLERCVAACEFFLKGLHRTTRASGAIALSYTPLDKSQVINTNADISSLLFRVGKETGRSDFGDLAKGIVRFVLETHNQDGSWNYNAPDVDGGKSKIDNYHTGMNLCALMDLIPSWDDRAIPVELLRTVYRKGLEFYIDHLFDASGQPRWTIKSLYPLDIYSFAQGIITLMRASSFEPAGEALRDKAAKRCSQSVSKCIELMAKKDGGFRYQHHGTFHVNINSLRWADALMCSALLHVINSQR